VVVDGWRGLLDVVTVYSMGLVKVMAGWAVKMGVVVGDVMMGAEELGVKIGVVDEVV
jgi:hypothetical protein